ncbi:hypothetical protein HK099_005444 [Clydaea vesicula]|uniref:S-formylglutathione hydrolase n=1 Tax=Clydaea vesicula TaxID=447962 RepID=A0AAD5XUX8_9FUNG|nr:hypothetical protein HK099_005444 [Clydaea vesicula]
MSETSSSKVHDGCIKVFKHSSQVLGCEMNFSVFIPKQTTKDQQFPQLYFLSGLTCNHENFVQKSCALKRASELQIVLICPDTSPRNLKIEGEDESWDFGSGAGFYVDATEEKWKNYQMYTCKHCAICHSMGGHGALSIALKNPGKYKSVSAFAPISNPVNCPWGQKAFTGYLGTDKETWNKYDSAYLIEHYKNREVLNILVDQGDEDKFYKEKQLLVESLASVVNPSVKLQLRIQSGYDHRNNELLNKREDSDEINRKLRVKSAITYIRGKRGYGRGGKNNRGGGSSGGGGGRGGGEYGNGGIRSGTL